MLHDADTFLGEKIPLVALFLGQWLYDWQTLSAGIMAIFAAYYWGNAVIRAAESRAGESRVRANQIRHTPAPPPSSLSERSAPDLRLSVDDRRATNIKAVRNFRSQLRIVLSRTPCTDDPLTQAQSELCKSLSSFALEGHALQPEGERQHYFLLKNDLSDLAALKNITNCRDAWQVLTRVNKLARELENMFQQPASKQAVQ